MIILYTICGKAFLFPDCPLMYSCAGQMYNCNLMYFSLFSMSGALEQYRDPWKSAYFRRALEQDKNFMFHAPYTLGKVKSSVR